MLRSTTPRAILTLIAVLVWLAAYLGLADSGFETALYDYQQRLQVALKGTPLLPNDMVVAAVDPDAYEQGLRYDNLPEIARDLGPNAMVVDHQPLDQFLCPDPDGKLRGIKLYHRTTKGLELAPPLAFVLKFKGIDPGQVRVTGRGLSFPGGEIHTDSQGRIFPRFPVTDYYRYWSASGFWPGLYRPAESELMSAIQALAPISIPDLFRKSVPLEGKLVLLGMFVPEAESVEFSTPGGQMVRLELYASIIGNLLNGGFYTPLRSWQDALLAALFLSLLSALLHNQSTSASLVVTAVWAVAWLALHQGLLSTGHFGRQGAVLLAALALLVFHLLQRSWRVNLFLQSLGGHTPLDKKGEEITATILFTNLPDLIKAQEETTPELAQAAREAHSRCVGRVINKHGGRLVDLQGDSQMIAFGLDGGNHEQQAAACALEIVTQVDLLMGMEPGQAYCGLVTGPVAVGQVGGGMYRGVAAIGDTTNSAARLLGKARETKKSVLASAQTVEALGPRALAEEVGEIAVKGRSEPLKVWEVKSFAAPPLVRAPVPSRASRNAPLLVFSGAALLALLVAVQLSKTAYFYYQTLDMVTPTDASFPIVFAGLDEASVEEQPWPWPRRLHARALENCLKAGAGAIFVDFLFEDPTNPVDDQALTNVVLGHPNIVVGAAARDNQGLPTPPKLLPELLQSSQWGLVNHAPQQGSESMRYGLWQLVSEEGKFMPGSAQKIALLLTPRVAAPPNQESAFFMRWGPKPTVISYRRLLNPDDPIFRTLQGKLVIIGDNFSGRSDAFETPFGTLKGAMIHALAMQTVLTDGLLTDASDSGLTILACGLYGALTLWLAWWAWGVGGQLSVMVFSLLGGAFMVWGAAEEGIFLGFLPIAAPACSCIVGWTMSILDTGKALTNYIPRTLSRRLEQDGNVADITTTGTILLTDIRGYTTLSEGRSPAEILDLLNNYHERTAQVYQMLGGHLITYQGDAQIVVFGSLERVHNPVLQAVRAAQCLPAVVEQVAREAGLEQGVLRVGSGIATGPVTVSLMGTEGQLQYSVFGAPVRQAHHLQSLSDQVESSIMLDHRSSLKVKFSVKTQRHQESDGTPFYTVE